MSFWLLQFVVLFVSSNNITEWTLEEYTLPINIACTVCALTEDEQSVFFIGGRSVDDWKNAFIFEYNLQTHKFTFHAPWTHQTRSDSQHYTYNNGIIYYYDDINDNYLNSYNMLTKEIKTYSTLPPNINIQSRTYDIYDDMCLTFYKSKNMVIASGGEFYAEINDTSPPTTNKTFLFDINTEIWSILPAESINEREDHACESIEYNNNHLLFLIGGQSKNTIEYYNESINKFTLLDDKINYRNYPRSLTVDLNDKIEIYIFGGLQVEIIVLNKLTDIIYVKSGGNNINARECSCALYVQPYIYIFGGESSYRTDITNTIERSNALYTEEPTKYPTQHPSQIPTQLPTDIPTISNNDSGLLYILCFFIFRVVT